jgi:hypothetical protein
MSNLRQWWSKPWAPFCLVVAGAIILYLLGFTSQDGSAVILMAALVVGAGVCIENVARKRSIQPVKKRSF